jgi:hypothetical protein
LSATNADQREDIPDGPPNVLKLANCSRRTHPCSKSTTSSTARRGIGSNPLDLSDAGWSWSFGPNAPTISRGSSAVVGYESRTGTVHGIRGEPTMTDRETWERWISSVRRWSTPEIDCLELRREELGRALTRAQRKRIVAGQLEPGDVAALRRFICLTQPRFRALPESRGKLISWPIFDRFEIKRPPHASNRV